MLDPLPTGCPQPRVPSLMFSSVAVFSGSRAMQSAASASRWRAFAFTCAAVEDAQMTHGWSVAAGSHRHLDGWVACALFFLPNGVDAQL